MSFSLLIDEISADDYLLHFAPPNQLNRLRKPDLIRLYNVAGLLDDPELLTKSEITDAIVAARDDVASLPPSSPPGKGDGASSDYSSDEGNVAGDEETDVGCQLTQSGPGTLRRRVTHDWGKTNARPIKGRSLSMGHLLGPVEGSNPVGLQRKSSTRLGGDPGGSGSRFVVFFCARCQPSNISFQTKNVQPVFSRNIHCPINHSTISTCYPFAIAQSIYLDFCCHRSTYSSYVSQYEQRERKRQGETS